MTLSIEAHDMRLYVREITVQNYRIMLYIYRMEVSVTDFRAELASWIQAARNGDDVTITEHGTPVARLVTIDAAATIDELTDRGIIAPSSAPKRKATRMRGRAKSTSSVADLLVEQRR